ncbi:MAG: hypothetical protein ABEK50_18215 [bacterium]
MTLLDLDVDVDGDIMISKSYIDWMFWIAGGLVLLAILGLVAWSPGLQNVLLSWGKQLPEAVGAASGIVSF